MCVRRADTIRLSINGMERLRTFGRFVGNGLDRSVQSADSTIYRENARHSARFYALRAASGADGSRPIPTLLPEKGLSSNQMCAERAHILYYLLFLIPYLKKRAAPSGRHAVILSCFSAAPLPRRSAPANRRGSARHPGRRRRCSRGAGR